MYDNIAFLYFKNSNLSLSNSVLFNITTENSFLLFENDDSKNNKNQFFLHDLKITHTANSKNQPFFDVNDVYYFKASYLILKDNEYG